MAQKYFCPLSAACNLPHEPFERELMARRIYNSVMAHCTAECAFRFKNFSRWVSIAPFPMLVLSNWQHSIPNISLARLATNRMVIETRKMLRTVE